MADEIQLTLGEDEIQITLEEEGNTLTLSNVATNTPAQVSDLSNMPLSTGWVISNLSGNELRTIDVNNMTMNQLIRFMATLANDMKNGDILDD